MTTTFQPPLSIPIACGAHREVAVISQPVANGRAIAAALSLQRHAVALRLLESVGNWSKFASDLTGDLDAYLQREFYAQVDYLALYFRTGDQTYRDLYVGEKIKQAYHEPESALQQQLARRGEIAESDRQTLEDLLR